MTATGWKGGSYGVRVGHSNAEKYFSKGWTSISVEIDRQLYEFPLSKKTFWTTCPEFRGNAIERWLLRHRLAPWPHGKPPRLVLTHLGGNLFRLSKA
jgi:hypothetical protein